MNPDNILAMGEACFKSADRDRLAGCFDQLQAAQPDSIPAAFLWCLVKILEGRAVDISGIIQDNDVSNLCLLNRVCNKALNEKHYDALQQLNVVLEKRPSGIIPCYYLACSIITQNRWVEGCNVLDQFRSRLSDALQVYGIGTFIQDRELNVVLRQGRLCIGPDEVRKRISGVMKTPLYEPDIKLELRVTVPGRTYICACNGTYFDAMGELFVQQLLATPGVNIHIHVVEPSASVMKLEWVNDLGKSGRLGLSIETSPPVSSTTYYACSRFFVIPYFLDLYQQALVSLDIDIVPQKIEFDVHRYAEDHDFCCFVTERNEPASMLQASIMVWPNSKKTRRFCHDLQAFCLPELENPSMVTWMLDQAGLVCIKEAYNNFADPFRFGDLTELTGAPLEDHISEIIATEERDRLKNTVYPFEPRQITL